MQLHKLKTWPEYFEAVCSGRKSFELRKNDRNYREGDMLLLEEFNPQTQQYTDRSILVQVSYLLHAGMFGLENVVVMSITPEEYP